MIKSKHKVGMFVLGIVLLGSSAFARGTPENLIPKQQAQEKALEKYPGTVTESELEQEGGRWIYEFEITGRDQKTHEVEVDAQTGEIVEHEMSSGEKESGQNSQS